MGRYSVVDGSPAGSSETFCDELAIAVGCKIVISTLMSNNMLNLFMRIFHGDDVRNLIKRIEFDELLNSVYYYKYIDI